MQLFMAIISILFGTAFSYSIFVSIMFRLGDSGPFDNFFKFLSNSAFLIDLGIQILFMIVFILAGIMILIKRHKGFLILYIIVPVYFLAEYWAFRIGHDTFIYGILPTLVVSFLLGVTFLVRK